MLYEEDRYMYTQEICEKPGLKKEVAEDKTGKKVMYEFTEIRHRAMKRLLE